LWWPPSSGESQDTARVVALPAVRVNVLRSSLVLQGAPLSAVVIGAERTLGRGPSLAVSEALHGLPGVQADDRHNQALGERLSIRGFGARSTFGIRGIRVLVDGIPATMADGQTTLNHVDPAQIAGAELIRGAAGAFLGNAAGGALQLRTGRGSVPGLELVSGTGSLWRVNAFGGFAHGSGYGSWQRQRGAREHSESERWLIGGVLSRPTPLGRLEAALHGTRYQAQNPGSLTAEQVAADATQANPNNVRQRTSERGTHAQLGLGWHRQFGAVALELRAHGGVRALFNPIPPRIIELDRSFGGVRLQATAGDERLQLAAGGELEGQRDSRLNYLNNEGARGSLVLDQRESVRGAALFAHAGWTPQESVRLFAAVRRDAYRFAVRDRLLTATDPDDSGSRTLAASSVAGGAGLRLAAGLELFGNVATAFETPTTTELANRPDGSGGFNPELEPERTLGMEAGLRLQRSSWRTDVTAFRAGVRDKLIPFEVPSVPGRQFFRNAGRARHQGVEVSASARPLAALELRAAYTRLDVRFRKYAVGGEDYAGRRVPGVAGHRLDLEADARVGGDLQFLLRARRNGRVPVNDGNTSSAPAYTLVGARMTHTGVAAGPVTLVLHAGLENMFAAGYTAAVTVNAAAERYYEPGPGRTLYAGLSVTRR